MTLPTQQQSEPARSPARSAWWIGAIAGLVGGVVVFLFTGLAVPGFLRSQTQPQSDNSPAPDTGGHTFEDRTLLQTQPHASVRMVYQRVAENAPDIVCRQFTDEAARQFAANVGAADCPSAVAMLHGQVTGSKNEYSEPFFPPEYRSVPKTVSVLEISSCKLTVTGSPRLGWFRLQKVERDQWIITQHRQETC